MTIFDIYNNLYILFGIACLSVGFSRFEPMQNYFKRLTDYKGYVYNFLYKLLSCGECVGFWVTLGFTTNILSAGIVFILTNYLSYITRRL